MSYLRKRSKREVDTTDYLRMLGRMLRAAAVRCAESDEEELGELCRLDTVLHQVLEDTVRGLRESGHTWQQIGDAAGTTRQGAQQRWGRQLDITSDARA